MAISNITNFKEIYEHLSNIHDWIISGNAHLSHITNDDIIDACNFFNNMMQYQAQDMILYRLFMYAPLKRKDMKNKKTMVTGTDPLQSWSKDKQYLQISLNSYKKREDWENWIFVKAHIPKNIILFDVPFFIEELSNTRSIIYKKLSREIEIKSLISASKTIGSFAVEQEVIVHIEQNKIPIMQYVFVEDVIKDNSILNTI